MIDAHCHLDDKKFDKDRDVVIEESKKTLKAIINSSSSFESNAKNLKLADNSFIYCTLGLDPVSCLKQNKVDESIEFIRKNEKKAVAIGEVGIDFHWEKQPEKQAENFSRFIELANELNKPLLIHSRESMPEVLELLKKAEVPVVIHCFSGNQQQAIECIDRDYLLSINTNYCFLSGKKGLINQMDLDNMLTETDSPYNHPERKGRNEPKNVSSIVEFISKAKETSFSEVDKITTRNTERIFRIG